VAGFMKHRALAGVAREIKLDWGRFGLRLCERVSTLYRHHGRRMAAKCTLYARIADQWRRFGISREQWEAHQRAEAERDHVIPKAQTWLPSGPELPQNMFEPPDVPHFLAAARSAVRGSNWEGGSAHPEAAGPPIA
jgi:hypothetical protein